VQASSRTATSGHHRHSRHRRIEEEDKLIASEKICFFSAVHVAQQSPARKAVKIADTFAASTTRRRQTDDLARAGFPVWGIDEVGKAKEMAK
jgi:hypothetical protein